MQFCWGPCHGSINQMWNRAQFHRILPSTFHWVRDNRHCTLGNGSGHAFSFLCQESSPAQKRLRYVVLHGMWREGLLKSKAGSAFQTRAQVPAAKFPKRPHLVRYLVLDYGILRATERPCAALVLTESSGQKHMCCPGHCALRCSSSPGSGCLHTPFPS